MWWWRVQNGSEIGEVGVSVSPPGNDVVHVAAMERCGAAVDGAGAVDRPQRSTLCSVGGAFSAAGIEQFGWAAEHDRDDVGVAGDAPDRLGREMGAVAGFVH